MKKERPLRVSVPPELRIFLRGYVRLCPYFGATEEAVAVWLIRSSIMNNVQEQYLQKAKEMADLLRAGDIHDRR